jgi:hypothetical protein
MITLVLIFGLMNTTIAKVPSQLLICLGKIEKSYHKTKQLGPFYELNQNLINELTQVPGIEAQPEVLKKICKISPEAPLVLLEEILLNPSSWHNLKKSESPVTQKIAKQLIKEMNQQSPEILLIFLGALQAQMPTHNCLEKYIPGLNHLYRDVKWLQEEMDLKKIASTKDRLVPIFNRLRDLKEITQACNDEKSKNNAKSPKSASDQ